MSNSHTTQKKKCQKEKSGCKWHDKCDLMILKQKAP